MLRSIDLNLREKLKDKEFRRQWFRAQLEANVPDMFRALREDRAMTQQELATAAEMKQSAISRFEKSDEANWNFETLLTLAEALDAKLEIVLVKAENVISDYERREGDTTKKSSVLGAASVANRSAPDAAGFLRWFDTSSVTSAAPENAQTQAFGTRGRAQHSGVRPGKAGSGGKVGARACN